MPAWNDGSHFVSKSRPVCAGRRWKWAIETQGDGVKRARVVGLVAFDASGVFEYADYAAFSAHRAAHLVERDSFFDQKTRDRFAAGKRIYGWPIVAVYKLQAPILDLVNHSSRGLHSGDVLGVYPLGVYKLQHSYRFWIWSNTHLGSTL